MTRKLTYILLVLLIAATTLTACGKRGSLEVPPGEEDQQRQYPRGS